MQTGYRLVTAERLQRTHGMYSNKRFSPKQTIISYADCDRRRVQLLFGQHLQQTRPAKQLAS